ncbi:ribosomal RNA small subunit methyltransferase NEP1 [Platysternon megacephalum]|uniref:Ribosomal RNA small subunit methyltransferase NEP1 n=1 Tax=Platysternon megacephalum TaxID=55544 RepID=A0A4D9DJ71_9SAUR|nr:ribosomal RNA small subunit methyltransferase NEP1 [Platysternon megacephalum]
MDVKSRNHLLLNHEALVRDIKTSYVMDHMIADEVLTLQEEEKVKAQNLCSRLDQDFSLSQRPPLNIEEAKDRLRLLILRKYPRCLMVLDDIWDSWVLKAFDNQCQVLITGRDRSVTDSVTGNKYEIPVESGLAHDKGLEILSLFVNMKITDLPEEADSIVGECKGSPLVVSLIGALLRDFPNRWEYYLRQLQNKQFKRIRKSSSYDYEALDEAMSMSVEMLNENFKDYYKDLSVLQKDVKVPTKPKVEKAYQKWLAVERG